ncbi:MAG: DUF2188 domain-containing protein [Gammaproteobacteria bacterium]|nr:DUF2188 domain-containing protein [Gammaproteobacteria bacterium]
MPKKPGSHHVVPNPNSGWSVKKGGGKQASNNTPTKQEAVDIGRKISQNQGTELLIHNKEGVIKVKNSHGNDPYPPKG